MSIKVDREERFDLDQIYMEAVQMMTGRGGWPLSVFLTPDGEPFFGGTYWPPRARDGISGFDQVLLAVADAWQHRRPDVFEQAHKITQSIAEQLIRERSAGDLARRFGRHAAHGSRGCSAAVLRSAVGRIWDLRQNSPSRLPLCWLLRRWRRSGDRELLGIVTTTLDHMAAGGMFDHLGGGFHRYCVDDRWLVPHFEKMLYDNALLAICYLEAWQATGKEEYAVVVRQTLDYLLRDMTDPQGGFYSGEDADSEGQEGKFYLWTSDEIEAVLTAETATTLLPRVRCDRAGQLRGPKHPQPAAALGG